jgi:hypothetical protein
MIKVYFETNTTAYFETEEAVYTVTETIED